MFDDTGLDMEKKNIALNETDLTVGQPSLAPTPPAWNLCWELPLSLLSWGFFKLNKLGIGWLYQQYLNRNLNREITWRILSGQTLNIPIGLPVLMTKGPRWNTHGYIGTLGPFAVESSLAVETAIAQKSASSWTVVIYRYPNYQTWTQLSWLKAEHRQDWTKISLPTGRYSLGIRYYGLQADPTLPTINIDGHRIIAGEAVSPSANDFYQTLGQRTNAYYLALHYYIFTVLRLRRFLAADFVRCEYLPVGDPDTLFRYDYFLRGESLNIQVNPERLRDHWIYLSVYNRASLPILSAEIVTTTYGSPPLSGDGYYLLRIRPKRENLMAFEHQDLVVLRHAIPNEAI